MGRQETRTEEGQGHRRPGLRREDLDSNPIGQFRRWFDEALVENPTDPTAAALATADGQGRPSARMVLLKGFDHRGFVFFTNYESRKGRELAENPRAALLFYWPVLDRQVRIEGRVEKVSDEESDAYFASRPVGARIGAWASRQSRVVQGREELDQAYQELERRYAGQDVPRPSFWGGYRVIPDDFEFWQGRVNRLHDRFRYRREGEGWVVERLAP